MERLKKRAEYRAVGKGRRFESAGFVLQARPRAEPGPAGTAPRFGFTVTRKVGNAVVRNRIKRRLKNAVGRVGPESAAAGTDYVLFARRAALTRPFDDLVRDVVDSLDRLARPQGGRHRDRNGDRTGKADAG